MQNAKCMMETPPVRTNGVKNVALFTPAMLTRQGLHLEFCILN
jgi:hypothetical protein